MIVSHTGLWFYKPYGLASHSAPGPPEAWETPTYCHKPLETQGYKEDGDITTTKNAFRLCSYVTVCCMLVVECVCVCPSPWFLALMRRMTDSCTF